MQPEQVGVTSSGGLAQAHTAPALSVVPAAVDRLRAGNRVPAEVSRVVIWVLRIVELVKIAECPPEKRQRRVREYDISDVRELTIGREKGNDLRLEESSCSGRHARLFRDADMFRLEDLGSRNGTFLGDERIAAPFVVPYDNDVRLSGHTYLRIRSPFPVGRRLFFCPCGDEAAQDIWGSRKVPCELNAEAMVLRASSHKASAVRLEVHGAGAAAYGLALAIGGDLAPVADLTASNAVILCHIRSKGRPILFLALKPPALYTVSAPKSPAALPGAPSMIGIPDILSETAFPEDADAPVAEEDGISAAWVVEPVEPGCRQADGVEQDPQLAPASPANPVAAAARARARAPKAAAAARKKGVRAKAPSPLPTAPARTPAPEPAPPPRRHDDCPWECGPEDIFCPGCGHPLRGAEVRLTIANGPAVLLYPGFPAYVWDKEGEGSVRVSPFAAGTHLKLVDGGEVGGTGGSVAVRTDGDALVLTLRPEGKKRLGRGHSIRTELSAEGPMPGLPLARYIVCFARRPRLDLKGTAFAVVWPGGELDARPRRVALFPGRNGVLLATRCDEGPPFNFSGIWRHAADNGAVPDHDRPATPGLEYRVLPTGPDTARVLLRWSSEGTTAGEYCLELLPRLVSRLRVENYRPPIVARAEILEHPLLGDPHCRLPLPIEVREPLVLTDATVVGCDGEWAAVRSEDGIEVRNLVLVPGPARLLVDVDGTKMPRVARHPLRVRLAPVGGAPPINLMVGLIDPVEMEREDDYLSIDFGTTATCCAFSAAALGLEPMPLPLERDERCEVPSALFFENVLEPDNPVYVIGAAARERMAQNPAGYVDRIKLQLLRAHGREGPRTKVRDAAGHCAGDAV